MDNESLGVSDVLSRLFFLVRPLSLPSIVPMSLYSSMFQLSTEIFLDLLQRIFGLALPEIETRLFSTSQQLGYMAHAASYLTSSLSRRRPNRELKYRGVSALHKTHVRRATDFVGFAFRSPITKALPCRGR